MAACGPCYLCDIEARTGYLFGYLVEASLQAEYNEMAKLLQSAPDEAIDKIAERIREIEKYNNERRGENQ